jgi:hypothetical protein
MSGFVGPIFLANPGTTGNNTHASVRTTPGASKLAVAYVAEVAGTTATWKVQASMDNDPVSDANANWFDMPYILPSTDTLSQAAIVRTTLGSDVIWLALATTRFVRRVRLVVTSNTGQTYRAEMTQQYN